MAAGVVQHVVGLCLFVATIGGQDPTQQQIDVFVNAIMQCNGIPGVNLAVVKDGQVYYTTGYGVKNLDTQEPLTSHTLMNIASVSKHFASTTMAKVFEDSTFDWKSSVRSILGADFHLSDGYMSDKASVTDLLSHRVGVARHDLVRVSGISLDEMTSRLRHLESSREFRDEHQYNNLMYNLADNLIRTLSGRDSWEDILQESFLDPLNMSSTTFVTDEGEWPEFATAYLSDGGSLREMSLQVNKADYTISTAPGGIGTNAEDMAKWMLFQLSGGRTPEGVPLVDPGLLADTHEHSGVTGDSPMYEYPRDPVTYDRNSKALGWHEGFYRDYRVTGHSGSKAGFETLYSLFPGVNLGIYSTVTGPSEEERDLIHLYIADLLLNETAWLDPATVCDVVSPASSHTNARKTVTDGVHSTREPQISLQPYQGTFGHFGYGNLTIFINSSNGVLEMEYGPGPNVRWSLEQITDTEFIATGYDEYWYMSYDAVFEDVGGGNYDRVEIDFDSRAPPTFIRDLDMADGPPPPELCV